MINYRCSVKPKTSRYAHGGHVHNLVYKAYQGHSLGGDVYDSSNAIVNKINDHLSSISSEDIGNQIIGRTRDQFFKHRTSIPTTNSAAPKFEHGAKLIQELLKKYSGNN